MQFYTFIHLDFLNKMLGDFSGLRMTKRNGGTVDASEYTGCVDDPVGRED